MIREVIDTRLGPVSLERSGSGPDLVMLHSLMSDLHIFDEIVEPLSADWRVNLVDLPGYGDTGLVDEGIDNYADVVGALLTDGGFDSTTTTLVGNGLGAFVALGTAVHHSELFDKMVLVGCGAGFADEVRPVFQGMANAVGEGGMAAVIEQAIRRIFPEDYLNEHPDEAEERRVVLRRTDPVAFQAACRSLSTLDYTAESPLISNPTVVVVGSEDEATPPALCQDLADRIPGAGYIELPGIAHAPQLQDPSGFLEVVTPFLRAR